MKNVLQRLPRHVLSDFCYWTCNYLEQHTDRRTIGARQAAGDAVAVSWMLNWRRALDEGHSKLPSGIASALGAFSAEEWHDVMNNASLAESLMIGIDRHEWAHLRRESVN